MSERKLGPGVYVNYRGEMYLDVPELLRHHGIPDTPTMRDEATAALLDAMHELYQGIPADVVECGKVIVPAAEWLRDFEARR